jgi:hypothetical protein
MRNCKLPEKCLEMKNNLCNVHRNDKKNKSGKVFSDKKREKMTAETDGDGPENVRQSAGEMDGKSGRDGPAWRIGSLCREG